jgi:hypothetical protein
MMKLKFGILLAASAAVSTLVCTAGYSENSGFVASFSTGSGVAYSLDLASYNYQLAQTGAYGNQIKLAAGSDLHLANFSVSYGSDYSLAGGLTVSLYANNGAGGAPGELLYTSSPIDINSGGGTVSINYGNPLIPNELTFLVEFSGQDATHKAGLLFPNADPSTGSLAYKDYWVKDGNSFSLQHAVVPEPGTYALAGTAGLAWLAFAGYRRFRK